MSDAALDDLIPPDHPAVAAPARPDAPPRAAAADPLDALVPDSTQPGAEEPPPADDRALAAPASAIARASLAPNPETQMKRYMAHFGQPETDFKMVGDKIVRRVPDGPKKGTWAYVEPSLTGGKGAGDQMMRGLDWMASGVGPAIPAAVGTGVGAVTVPGGAAAGTFLAPGPGTIAGGAVGAGIAGAAAAGAEGGREWLDKALAGDHETSYDPENMGWWGLAGASGEPVGKVLAKGAGAAGRLIQKIPGVKNMVTVTEEAGKNLLGLTKEARDAVLEHMEGKWQEIQQVARDAKELGVNLSLGQKTGAIDIQKMERQVARFPEGSQKIANLRQAQNDVQVPGAVRKTLDDIAPAGPPGAQVEGFRDAADVVKNQALDERSELAAEAYKKALDDRKDRFWNEDLDPFFKRPSVQAGLANAKKIAAEEGFDRLTVPTFENGKRVANELAPDWRSWHYIKKGIDAEIEAHTDPITGRVDSYGRAATLTKKALMNKLYAANPEYKAANAMYGTASEAVDGILKGGVGFINKMTGPDRQNMVNRVFSGQNLMPEEINKMRGLFENAGRLPEWNAGVRSYISDKLADAMAVTQGGERSNVGGKFYKSMFDTEGNPLQSAVIKAAIGDPAIVDRWERLGGVLKAVAHQLPEGSQTATDLMASSAESKVASTAKAISRSVNLTKPLHVVEEVANGINHLRSPAARKQLVQYLLTPEGDRALKSLPMRITNANSPKSQALLGSIFIDSGVLANSNASKSSE